MKNNNKQEALGIYFLIRFMLFNSLGTAAMYFVTLVLGKHSEMFNLIRARAYAAADFPFTIIPLLIAVYGLYNRKFWGWVLTLIISGVYLHSMVVLITEDLQTRLTPMFIMNFYFVGFAVLAIIYLINKRKLFFS